MGAAGACAAHSACDVIRSGPSKKPGSGAPGRYDMADVILPAISRQGRVLADVDCWYACCVGAAVCVEP
jgi:hypothetical protein